MAKHVIAPTTYLVVFIVLLSLMALTMLAWAVVDVPGLNLILAMTIAVGKATVVVLWFMHVKYSSRLTWVFAGAALMWLIIAFALALSDYTTRAWLIGT